MPILAASYLRMSKDSQDTSVPAQRTEIASMAKARGYKIIREYIDEGISGDATEKRIAFQRMLADAQKGEFKAILCWDQDRFGRFDSLEAGWWILPLRNAGVQLVTVAQGVIDWNDFTGRVMYTLQQEAKHQFLRDLSRNVVRGKLQAAKEGRWMGGSPPYGFTLNEDSRLIINEDEAEIVRKIFRLYVNGGSHKGIALDFNSQQIPSPAGKLWSGNTIGGILKNPIYLGHTRYNRRSSGKYSSVAKGVVISKKSPRDVTNDQSLWVVIENTHKAIISEKQFAAAQEAKNLHKQWTGSNRQNQIMFKSLLRCGHCGYSMHSSWVPAMKDIVYQCSHHYTTGGCESNRTYQTPLLDMVLQTVQTDFIDPAVIKEIQTEIKKQNAESTGKSHIGSLQRKLASITSKLEKAEARLLDVPSDMVATVADQIRKLRIEQAAAREECEHAARPQATIQREQLAALDLAVSQLEKLATATAKGPSELLIKLLRSTINTITVTSRKLDHFRQPNGKYQIAELQIVTKFPVISR